MSKNDPPRGLRYRDAGVDIDRATAAKDRISVLARTTFTPGVLSEIGLFGGLFQLDVARWKEPVLVASTDGVGTKLAVAAATGRHGTVGEDLVNHSVNDILVQGATPLFFLDYFASGGLPPETVAEVVAGMARGCRQNGVALLGGETAEMPGMYRPGDYDIAGTIVGVVDRANVVDGKGIAPGDVLLGLASDGLHTNGYSLARKALLEVAGLDLHETIPELGESLADALLRVHLSYLLPLRPALDAGIVKGLAHITGGGITENLPRILQAGLDAHIHVDAWTVPPLFALIAKHGNVERAEMLRTFNMGVGMIVVTAPESLGPLRAVLPDAFVLGEIQRAGSPSEPARVVYL